MSEFAETIRNGQPAVMPTDTIYGLVASAFDADAVERVYELKERTTSKPCIVLISDTSQLQRFDINPTYIEQAQAYWPGPVSVALPQPAKKWTYLARGSGFITFRLPELDEILELLKLSGPVIAPSANPEGLPPAETIEEAQEYFGDAVETYIDHGNLRGKPSKIIRIEPGGSVTVLRD